MLARFSQLRQSGSHQYTLFPEPECQHQSLFGRGDRAPAGTMGASWTSTGCYAAGRSSRFEEIDYISEGESMLATSAYAQAVTA